MNLFIIRDQMNFFRSSSLATCNSRLDDGCRFAVLKCPVSVGLYIKLALEYCVTNQHTLRQVTDSQHCAHHLLGRWTPIDDQFSYHRHTTRRQCVKKHGSIKLISRHHKVSSSSLFIFVQRNLSCNIIQNTNFVTRTTLLGTVSALCAETTSTQTHPLLSF